MSALVTVYVAIPYPVVRCGFRALLEEDGGFSVLGEDDGLYVIEEIERLKPSILIVSDILTGLNSVCLTREVKQRVPETRILFMSFRDDREKALEALRAGVDGFVSKDASADEIIQALRDVSAGERYLSREILNAAIVSYIESSGQALGDTDLLTVREREILQLTAEGYSNSRIAEELSISARTVETHRSNLMRKLGLRGQTDLIRYAIRTGILEP